MRQVVYVLTGGASSVFYGMLRLSAKSLKAIHPHVHIHVVADEATGELLKALGDPLFEQITAVPVSGSAVWQSRWIKTQLPAFVDGDFLYLDVDTLVVRNAVELECAGALAMVLDRCKLQPTPGFPGWAIAYYQQLGWRCPTEKYFNGGVIYARGGAETRKFFSLWHTKWLQFTSTGHCVDQPALNSAVADFGMKVTVLPWEYNAMVSVRESLRWSARIIHFFADGSALSCMSSYRQLIDREIAGKGASAAEIRRFVARGPFVKNDSIRLHLAAHDLVGAAKLVVAKKILGRVNC